MKNDSTSKPRAVASGVIFGNVDCYVMEDGSTVLSQRGMLRGLRGGNCGPEKGDLGRYLARLPEKYSGLCAGPILEFETPDGHLAHGRPSHAFVAMCKAYADMYAEGSIHKARIPIARNCIAVLAGLADIGIDEMVYRASNYRPAALVQAQPVGITAEQLAQMFAPLIALVKAQNDRLDALESQARTGHVMAAERSNAIKQRVRSCALDLSKYGVEKMRAASLRIHKRIKDRVGWSGVRCRLDNMPARHEADVLRELEIIENETVGAVTAARQLRFPALAVVGNRNAKRSAS